MEWREVLQIEIWSKKTSRKLIVGLLLLLIAIALFYSVNFYWMTKWERIAGRAALAKIDALQNFKYWSDQEFENKDTEAKASVEAAFRASWTVRDRGIAQLLSTYLTMTELDRSSQKSDAKSRAFMIAQGKPEQDIRNDRSELTSHELRDSFRGELHGLLHQ